MIEETGLVQDYQIAHQFQISCQSVDERTTSKDRYDTQVSELMAPLATGTEANVLQVVNNKLKKIIFFCSWDLRASGPMIRIQKRSLFIIKK